MKYIHNFQTHDEMNEGLKSWVSTFLILAGLGLVPPSIGSFGGGGASGSW